jgi:hypothetical protein
MHFYKLKFTRSKIFLEKNLFNLFIPYFCTVYYLKLIANVIVFAVTLFYLLIFFKHRFVFVLFSPFLSFFNKILISLTDEIYYGVI